MIEPGIYDGLSEDIYHGDSYPAPCLSTGVLKDLLNKSPLHAFLNHPALNPSFTEGEADESKFDIGRAAHALLLEGEDNVEIIPFDSYQSTAAKLARDNARMAGKIPLKQKEWDRVSRMVEAANQQLRESELGINDLLAEGKSERSFIWQEDDVWLKIRPDWMPHDETFILDYKTTGLSANPTDLDRHILNMGYHIQDCLYKWGVRTYAEREPRFVFMFQETSDPFLCSFVELRPAFAALGWQEVETGVKLWRRCLASGEWPGYPKEICGIDLPSWELKKLQDRELMDAEEALV